MKNIIMFAIAIVILLLASCSKTHKLFPINNWHTCTAVPADSIINSLPLAKPGGEDDDPIIVVEMTVDGQGIPLDKSLILFSDGSKFVYTETDSTGIAKAHLPSLKKWHMHIWNSNFMPIDKDIQILDTITYRRDTMLLHQ